MSKKVNYKEKYCQVCKELFKPTSPKQKFCLNCKVVVAKLKQQQRDKKRTLLKQKNKESFIRNCPLCGDVFSTFYPKKIYCGAEKCEILRKRKNVKAVDIVRNAKRKENRRFKRARLKGAKLKFIKYFIESINYKLIEARSYTSSHKSTLKLKCPEGHTWETTWHNLYSSNGRCMTCYLKNNYVSKPELLVREFIEENFPGINVKYNDRSVLRPKELDFYFPDNNLAIEVCGLYWHGELSSGKHKSYHYDKMKGCYAKGVRLITVFEDELITNKNIVFSRISQALGKPKRRIFARKCVVKELTSIEANTFYKYNHIQGKSTALVRYGLYYNDELVCVGSLGKITRQHTSTKDTIELKRFCTLPSVSVVGGVGKIFKRMKFFALDNGYTVIKSYCDMRYANIFRPVYEVLGFELEGFTKYTPHYFKDQQRYRNFSLRKTPEERLTGKTEWQLRQVQGYDRIWDCGHRTYIYKLIN